MKCLAIPITSRCEESCPFCFVTPQKDMTLEEVSELLFRAKLDPAIKKVVITGGNPELHPDFLAICRLVKQSGFLLKMHANYSDSAIWNKYLDVVDELSIALDSLVSNDFRSAKNYQNSLLAIDYFLNKKIVQIHTIVSSKNLAELSRIKAFLLSKDENFFVKNSWKLFRLVAQSEDLKKYTLSDEEWEDVVSRFKGDRVIFIDNVLDYRERLGED
jgi:MoaA/NifB/PqqE/SkfB family radical SAM enzyme